MSFTITCDFSRTINFDDEVFSSLGGTGFRILHLGVCGQAVDVIIEGSQQALAYARAHLANG